jgi:two-component system LytT family response regulator
MTCILIDDEADGLDLLALLMQKHCPAVQVIGQYNNPKEGVTAIRATHPNLVLLDVEMPELNGFDVLEACRDIPFHVIFTTAFNEYAVRAFKYSAIGYLLKPVDQEDLKEAVQRAQHLLTVGQHAQQRDLLFDLLQPNKPIQEKIALPTSEGILFLHISEILYCEAEGNYTKIFCLHPRKPLLFTKLLKYIEELLPADTFYRSHNSYLVNLKHVEQYSRDGELLLKDGHKVPVSRAQKEGLLERLNNI